MVNQDCGKIFIFIIKMCTNCTVVHAHILNFKILSVRQNVELFDAKLHNVEIVSIYIKLYNVFEYKMELLKLQLSLLLKVMLDHAFL